MTFVPDKGRKLDKVTGVLDRLNPVLAGVSLGRGGKWGIAGGIGSLGAQIADEIWRSKKKKKKPAAATP